MGSIIGRTGSRISRTGSIISHTRNIIRRTGPRIGCTDLDSQLAAQLTAFNGSKTPCCPMRCCCARTATNDSNDLIEARGRIDLSLDLAVLMESEIDAHG